MGLSYRGENKIWDLLDFFTQDACLEALAANKEADVRVEEALQEKEQELSTLRAKIERLERRIKEDAARAEKEIEELKRLLEEEKEE